MRNKKDLYLLLDDIGFQFDANENTFFMSNPYSEVYMLGEIYGVCLEYTKEDFETESVEIVYTFLEKMYSKVLRSKKIKKLLNENN